jgi:uncharacterized protein YjbI with pentapeptide repeats
VDLSFLESLTGITLVGATAKRCNFQESKMEGAKFENADLRDSDFTDADLSRADLFNANLDDAILEGATLISAKLFEANLQRTRLKGARLNHTSLGQSKWVGAELYDTDLTGSELGRDYRMNSDENISYNYSDFRDAKFDNRTILPDGRKWIPELDVELFVKYGMARSDEDIDKLIDSYDQTEMFFDDESERED